MGRRFVLWLRLLVLVSCFAHEAAAQTCGNGERPWVLVSFEWQAQFEHFETAVLDDLRAGFAGRDIDVCPQVGAPSKAPLAAVLISAGTDASRIGVEIRDTVTNKRVGRDVDLSNVPEDGQAFAIALATDELVWASWAELALERAREPKAAPPPPQVKKAIDKQLPPPAPKRYPPRVALQAAGDDYGGGQRQYGLDGALLLPAWERVKLDLGVGVRQGLPEDAPNGRIGSNAAHLSLGARYLFAAASGYELGVGASAQGSWVSLRGEAPRDAEANELAGPVFYARGSLSFDLRLLGPVWFAAALHAGAPLRGLEASADGEVITGTSGLLLGAQAGLAVEL